MSIQFSFFTISISKHSKNIFLLETFLYTPPVHIYAINNETYLVS